MIALITLPLTAAAVTAQAPAARPAPSALSQFADSLERSGFSGSVLVADQRRVLLFRNMGIADRASGRAITASDHWRWASVSKQITAALVLREVDARRIALDAPVATYLPAFANGPRALITVRQLLQHTSGLPNLDAGPSDADGMPRAYRERGADVGDAAYARLCSGALTGTLDALLAFDRILLGTMLSPAAKRELWRGEPQFGYAVLGAWAFEATLGGCAAPVRLVERRGDIGGIQVRNVLMPERELVVILFTNRADVEFGEVWQGRGLTYDALSATPCGSAPPAP